MRTYYRGSDALVTDDHIVWRSSSTHIFPIEELRNIVIVQGPTGNRSRSAIPLTAGAGLLIAAVTAWVFLGPTVGYTALAAATVVSAAIMLFAGRRTARAWHLLGAYRGSMVTIYSSTDLRTFNQVTRALRRSTEKDLASA